MLTKSNKPFAFPFFKFIARHSLLLVFFLLGHVLLRRPQRAQGSPITHVVKSNDLTSVKLGI